MFSDLIRLCKSLHDHLRLQLEPHGIHRGQCRILHFLAHHGPVSQVEIARHLSLRRATVTRMLQRMERNNMIHRFRNSADERMILVELTEPGNHAESRACAARNSVESVIKSTLTTDEQIAFREYLGRISDALNPDKTQSSASPITVCGDNHE